MSNHLATPQRNHAECGTSNCVQYWCSGAWDMSNAKWLLHQLRDRGMVRIPPANRTLHTPPLYAFEVGNELVSHEFAPNTTADMVALAAMIQEVWAVMRCTCNSPPCAPTGTAASALLATRPRAPPVVSS